MKMNDSMQKRDGFRSRGGFIIACIGSAVGMGNIWRFPMLVSTWGGLTFLIPYFIFVILIGSTGVIGEYALGRAGGAGPMGSFGMCTELRCGKRKIGERIGYIPSDGYPFAEADEYDSEETVTISKEKYDSMVEDLLTMAELIDMVSDMRTKDVRAIQEFSKFVPAFAAYERNRLSVYREAAKEAEDIIARWEDELEDDYEPEEFYSD